MAFAEELEVLTLVYPRIVYTDLSYLICNMCFPSLTHGA